MANPIRPENVAAEAGGGGLVAIGVGIPSRCHRHRVRTIPMCLPIFTLCLLCLSGCGHGDPVVAEYESDARTAEKEAIEASVEAARAAKEASIKRAAANAAAKQGQQYPSAKGCALTQRSDGWSFVILLTVVAMLLRILLKRTRTGSRNGDPARCQVS